MKSFDDFLELLKNNPVYPKVMQELSERTSHLNIVPTPREEALQEMQSEAYGLIMREILRLYHNWASECD